MFDHILKLSLIALFDVESIIVPDGSVCSKMCRLRRWVRLIFCKKIFFLGTHSQVFITYC